MLELTEGALPCEAWIIVKGVFSQENEFRSTFSHENWRHPSHTPRKTITIAACCRQLRDFLTMMFWNNYSGIICGRGSACLQHPPPSQPISF